MNALRKAFTLIELLVVISIIVILISILLPALRGAREAGQMSLSLNNLRQLQLALHNYVGDYKEFLPYHRWVYDVSASPRVYMGSKLVNLKYISSANVLWGPTRETNFHNFVSDKFINIGYVPNEFLMPEWLESSSNAGNVSIPVNMTRSYKTYSNSVRMPKPGEMMTMCEAFRTLDYTNNTPPRDGYFRFSAGDSEIIPYTWSSGQCARAYLDGHALARDPSALGDIGFVPTGHRTGTWVNASFSNLNMPYQ